MRFCARTKCAIEQMSYKSSGFFLSESMKIWKLDILNFNTIFKKWAYLSFQDRQNGTVCPIMFQCRISCCVCVCVFAYSSRARVRVCVKEGCVGCSSNLLAFFSILLTANVQLPLFRYGKWSFVTYQIRWRPISGKYDVSLRYCAIVFRNLICIGVCKLDSFQRNAPPKVDLGHENHRGLVHHVSPLSKNKGNLEKATDDQPVFENSGEGDECSYFRYEQSTIAYLLY